MLGAVFERELTTTARRRRAYAIRSVYGMVLLGVLGVTCRQAALEAGSMNLAGLGRLAREVFPNLLLAQGALVVLLTPALVAGTIAGEVQRKTLHDLLTSDLSSAEIVLGKLAAKLLHVAVLVASGLPILLIAGWIGGYEGWLVLASVGATLSMAFFLGGLSILASTQTRSVRAAMNLVFTVALSWLIVPGAAGVLLPRASWFGPSAYEWVEPVNAWLAPSTPFVLWLDLMRGAIRDADLLQTRLLGMVALQLLYGAVLTALAVVALRPSYRARQGRRVRRVATKRNAQSPERAAPERSACGDDAMLWKELFAPRAPLMYRPIGLSVALVLGWLLLKGTLDYALPAFRELWSSGYGVAPPGSARGLFLAYLRIVGTGIFLVHLLGVASDAAAGISSEREKDTWISLIATPLTGTEIIRAKVLGAVWSIRHTAATLLALGLIGVLAGSLHPVSLLAIAGVLAASTSFAAALGTWVSLRADDTMRASARTVATLLAVNLGSLLVTLPLLGARPLAFVGCSPVLLAGSLASYGDLLGRPSSSVLGIISDAELAALWQRPGPEMLWAIGASVLAYAVAAWLVTRSACRGFDALIDRPSVAGVEAEETRVSEPRSPHSRPRRTGRASVRS